MIRSWADREAFLANGGRLRFAPGADPGAASSWRDAESGEAIASALATRALAEQRIAAEAHDADGTLYRSVA